MKIELLQDGEKTDKKHDNQYIGYQMLSSDTAYKVHLLETGGWDVYLEDAIDSKKVPDGMTKAGYIKAVKYQIEKVINCSEDEWKQFYMEDPVEAIRLIDSAMVGYDKGIDLLSDWLK